VSQEFQIKKIDGKTFIYDIVRKKYVSLTPEEVVRQSVLRLLLDKGYPLPLIKPEHRIKAGTNDKRTDITVFRPDGSIFMIVECKAPSVPLSEKTVNQIAVYNSVLDAEYLLITNGKQMFVLKKHPTGNLVLTENIPDYQP